MRSLFSTPRVRFLRELERANTFLIIDVNNYAHRMFHAYSELETSEGVPSGHVYGVLNNLKMLTNKIKGRMCVVFVSDGEPKERLALYPDYKKPRRLAKDPEKGQMLLDVNRVLHMFPGIVAFYADGEADDTMATLARELIKQRKSVYVVSGDHDLWALAEHGITIVSGKNLAMMNARDVEKKTGLAPSHIRLHKAMYGDKSDFIPGVPRLQKKVFGMLNTTTLSGLKDQLDILPLAHRQKLKDNWEMIERNWSLVELKTVNYSVHPCGNVDTLMDFAARYECKSLFPWIEGLE